MPKEGTIHVIGGGTFSHVRNHLALAAPAFGGTAKEITSLLASYARNNSGNHQHYYEPVIHLTKMADPNSSLVTNDDVAKLVEKLKRQKDTRAIIMTAALCDFDGKIVVDDEATDSGPHASRLKSRDGEQMMRLTAADKIVGTIRKEFKEIFVVAFKTTTGETSDAQYAIALNALKRDGVNLVWANDTVTRNNMIVAPEETRYFETTNRAEITANFCKMLLARLDNTFTRSTVVPGDSVAWDDDRIPANLRKVVDHCIARGAYKTVRGVTAGHFAVKVDEGTILTSKRKRNFNNLSEEGLVLVEYENDSKVIAHGAKPSVGGLSQRIIFREHPDLDCIVHFHCPVKDTARDAINVAPQWQNECGSHQCGANTSRNLREYGDLKAVMLAGHGPNIVFNRSISAERVIDFIEANFDLADKTGGLVSI